MTSQSSQLQKRINNRWQEKSRPLAKTFSDYNTSFSLEATNNDDVVSYRAVTQIG